MKVIIDLGETYESVSFEMGGLDTTVSINVGRARTLATLAEAQLIRTNLDAFISRMERNEED